MPALLVLMLVVPILELWVIVQVAGEIGALNTIGVLILISIAGAWLLKREGMAAWRRLQASLASGRMPTNEVADGALILLGGALLLTPGFISDLVGVVMLLPPSRAAVKRGLRRAASRWIERRSGGSRRRNAHSVRVTRVARSSDVTPDLQSPEDGSRRASGGDSRDTP